MAPDRTAKHSPFFPASGRGEDPDLRNGQAEALCARMAMNAYSLYIVAQRNTMIQD